jgi:hypothetical protein
VIGRDSSRVARQSRWEIFNGVAGSRWRDHGVAPAVPRASGAQGMRRPPLGVASRLEDAMTLKDKLEIGLKEDAQYRKDNLPDDQVRGPEVELGAGRSPSIPAARDDKNLVPDAGDVARDDEGKKAQP